MEKCFIYGYFARIEIGYNLKSGVSVFETIHLSFSPYLNDLTQNEKRSKENAMRYNHNSPIWIFFL